MYKRHQTSIMLVHTIHTYQNGATKNVKNESRKRQSRSNRRG